MRVLINEQSAVGQAGISDSHDNEYYDYYLQISFGRIADHRIADFVRSSSLPYGFPPEITLHPGYE